MRSNEDFPEVDDDKGDILAVMEKNNQQVTSERERNHPMEEKQLEFMILNRKIQRRNVVIKNLRRNVVEEVMVGKRGDADEIRAKNLESNQEEEDQIITLQDDYASLLLAMKNSEEKLSFEHAKLELATKRQKDSQIEADTHLNIKIEIIKDIEHEKQRLESMLRTKDQFTDKLSKELESSVKEVTDLTAKDGEKSKLINTLKAEIETLIKNLREEKLEKKTAAKVLEEAEGTISECTIYVYVNICTYIYICIYIYIYIYICIYTYKGYCNTLQVCLNEYIHIYIHTHIHVYLNENVHI
jgi:DNA repair exonuclease SbcCD ATPase subunit